MVVYITKWALTQGILEIEVQKTSPEASGMLMGKKTGWEPPQYYHRGQWHKSKRDAVNKAEEMRHKAIKSTKRKLAKLIDMRF